MSGTNPDHTRVQPDSKHIVWYCTELCNDNLEIYFDLKQNKIRSKIVNLYIKDEKTTPFDQV